jgi:hypothetical protein
MMRLNTDGEDMASGKYHFAGFLVRESGCPDEIFLKKIFRRDTLTP